MRSILRHILAQDVFRSIEIRWRMLFCGNLQLNLRKYIKLIRQLMWYICFRSSDTAGPPTSYIVRKGTNVGGECSGSALDVIQRGRLQRRRQPLYTRSQEAEDTKGVRHMQEKEKYVQQTLSSERFLTLYI